MICVCWPSPHASTQRLSTKLRSTLQYRVAITKESRNYIANVRQPPRHPVASFPLTSPTPHPYKECTLRDRRLNHDHRSSLLFRVRSLRFHQPIGRLRHCFRGAGCGDEKSGEGPGEIPRSRTQTTLGGGCGGRRRQAFGEHGEQRSPLGASPGSRRRERPRRQREQRPDYGSESAKGGPSTTTIQNQRHPAAGPPTDGVLERVK